MIQIQKITPGQTVAAKMLIASVAQRIFVPDSTPQDFFNVLEEEGELRDVDEFQSVYEAHRGLFLVVMNADTLVGTGALKYHTDKVAELKRLWLLEKYHGQGIGYEVVSRLLKFGREQGYQRVWLQTGEEQIRAIRFYTRLGFKPIPSYRKSMDNISMELVL